MGLRRSGLPPVDGAFIPLDGLPAVLRHVVRQARSLHLRQPERGGDLRAPVSVRAELAGRSARADSAAARRIPLGAGAAGPLVAGSRLLPDPPRRVHGGTARAQVDRRPLATSSRRSTTTARSISNPTSRSRSPRGCSTSCWISCCGNCSARRRRADDGRPARVLRNEDRHHQQGTLRTRANGAARSAAREAFARSSEAAASCGKAGFSSASTVTSTSASCGLYPQSRPPRDRLRSLSTVVGRGAVGGARPAAADPRRARRPHTRRSASGN